MNTLIAVSYKRPTILRRYLTLLDAHEPDLYTIVIDVAPVSLEPRERCDLYITMDKANYSQAVNEGLKSIPPETEYIIWGNDDLEVNGPFVDDMLKPIIKNPKTLTGITWGTEWYNGVRVGFLEGALIAMHVNALQDIGMLDERFPGCSEDVDYSIRANRAGYDMEVVDVPIVHLNQGLLDRYAGVSKQLLASKYSLRPK
jgi:GT2 family glycosyltransferase